MTTANKITLIRILMIPAFVLMAIYYGESIKRGEPVEWQRFAAIVIFLVAAASDGPALLGLGGLGEWLVAHGLDFASDHGRETARELYAAAGAAIAQRAKAMLYDEVRAWKRIRFSPAHERRPSPSCRAVAPSRGA